MTSIGVIPGRFQPATLAHAKLFQQALAENSGGAFVVLVKGGKTGENKSKNPLDTKTQEQLISQLVPNIGIMEASAGSLTEIIYEILEPSASNVLYPGEDQFKFVFYCGTDRYQGYKKQAETPEYIQDVVDWLEEDKVDVKSIEVDVRLIERENTLFDETKINYSKAPNDNEISSYSATAVRNAIISGNDKLAKRMMGLEKNDYLYQKVARMITKGVMHEAVQEQINYILENI